MTEELILLECITDNPYQPRLVDNAEHIENLARSIAADGILQKPTARHTAESAQLAFGHSRRKAFEWLRSNFEKEGLPNRYNGYSQMPLNIEELSDEDMYRQAVSENVQRKDLDAIEMAKAMLVYRDQFKKNSDEIGGLFGMSGATVRGLVRLLDLPKEIQDKVASGDIPQSKARSLLTIARMDAKQVTKAVDSLSAGTSVDDVIVQSMRGSDTAFSMWEAWKDGKPCAGDGLWPLEMKPEKFPMDLLPELRAADVAKAMDLEFTADLRSKIEDYIETATRAPDFVSQFAETHKDADDIALMERVAHLLKPPACAACPLHASADRAHYCGLKFCHKRKVSAWVSREMNKVSKKLSIPIYNPAVDGQTTLPLNEHTYQDEYKRHAKLVDDHDADLRLQPHRNEYSLHKWTESNFVRVILVGKKAVAVKEKKRTAGASQQADEEKRRKQYEMERASRDASKRFAQEYAFKLFSVAFKGMDQIAPMCALARVNLPKKDAKKAVVLADLRARLACEALDNLAGYDWQLLEKGPVATAKFLQGVATSWSVPLPADFMDVAKGYQPVSAETETPKKKK